MGVINDEGVPTAVIHLSVISFKLRAEVELAGFLHSDSQEISGSRPSHSLRVITRMKVDIHNHILPKEWPDLKQVGNERHKFIKSLR